MTDAAPVDHGCLPAWHTADLPEPLPLSLKNALRTIGPGAILLAGSIGGGEWIAGPNMAIQYGIGILWIATLGILLQLFFNLEAVRYTLYTGEPITSGLMRLRPGRAWGIMYIVLGAIQLATPAMALLAAQILFAAFNRHAPSSEEELQTARWIAAVIMIGSVVLLLSGRKVERMLELASWVMIIFIFGFLVSVNLLMIPFARSATVAAAFFRPQSLPPNIDIVQLAGFLALAGSGGLGNLAISNWFRDKGFGMASCSGSFGGMLAKHHTELASVGTIFPFTPANASRWKMWWRYSLLDQTGLWSVGCVLGMFLNVNLALAIGPDDASSGEFALGLLQAQYLSRRLGEWMWFLCLMNGFWIIYSTHLGNTDCLTRATADIIWAAWPASRRWSSSRLFAALMLIFLGWGLLTLTFKPTALDLFKVLGVFATPILAIAASQVLLVNRRFLPRELRPPLWRQAGLVACAVIYGGVAVSAAYRTLTAK